MLVNLVITLNSYICFSCLCRLMLQREVGLHDLLTILVRYLCSNITCQNACVFVWVCFLSLGVCLSHINFFFHVRPNLN